MSKTVAIKKPVKKKLPELISDIGDFEKKVMAMSKEEFAYYVSLYQEKLNLQLIWFLRIFNKHFGVELTEFSELTALAKAFEDSLPVVKYSNYHLVPLSMFIYLKKFWIDELTAIKENWVIDPLDFAVLVAEHQRNESYQRNWSYRTIKEFVSEPLSKEAVDKLIDDAYDILDDGDSMKVPEYFCRLVAVNMSLYLNFGYVERGVEKELSDCIQDKHKTIIKRAENKLKKAALEINEDSYKQKKIAIEFTADELLALTVDSHKYLHKVKRDALAQLSQTMY